MSDSVTVIEIEEAPDGSLRNGNSLEVSKSDAVKGIESGKYKAIGYSQGVVPAEWKGKEKKRSAKGAEEETQAEE